MPNKKGDFGIGWDHIEDVDLNDCIYMKDIKTKEDFEVFKKLAPKQRVLDPWWRIL